MTKEEEKRNRLIAFLNAHPRATTIALAMFAAPAAATASLAVVGFTSAGIAPASLAALLQSMGTTGLTLTAKIVSSMVGGSTAYYLTKEEKEEETKKKEVKSKL